MTEKNFNPDRVWYLKMSAQKGLTPTCPFATCQRCPRYFQSVGLLSETGATSMDADEKAKWAAYWNPSDLWPQVDEQATSVCGAARPIIHSNFCPEVAGLRYGRFASQLIAYADIEDGERAMELLPPSDYHREWSHLEQTHFSECDLYSKLLHIPPVPPMKDDENLFEMKPGVGGLTLDLRILFTKLARWWLRKQKRI